MFQQQFANPYMGNGFNYGGGFGGFNAPGYSPVVGNIKPTHGTNPLTADEIKSLRKHVDQFVIGLTQDEMLRSICFHKNEDGTPALQSLGGNKVRCLVCGKEFEFMDDLTEEDLNTAVQNLLNIMQSIKLMYVDFPEQPARDFFQMIGLIEKIPGLYKLAVEDLKKHEQGYNFRYQNGPSYNGIYNAITSGFGAPGWGQYYQNAPMMNSGFGGFQQPQQMGYGMTPNGNAFAGAPIQPGSNGFGFQQPQQQVMGYQPQGMNYSYVPGQMAQQPMMGNQPNAAQAAVTQGAAQAQQPAPAQTPVAPAPQANPAAAPAQNAKAGKKAGQTDVQSVFSL